MELFNEATNLILLYHMMCFTDWVGRPEVRFMIGYSVMTAVFCNMSVHFFFLIWDSLRKIKLPCKKKLWQRQSMPP